MPVELLVPALLLANIAQAAYAVRAPRAPHAPLPAQSPGVLRSAKKGQQPVSPLAKSWRGKGALSPNTTPQRQRPFSASSHPQTPLSDPHNLAHSYSLSFPASSPDASFTSTTSSLPPTPSPVSAYRGRRGAPGRALDASLLSRLTQTDSDEEP
ncbi:hypothetical protein FA95DRAFT_1567555 [Auriscalpium vulgare]|uniref:Uncharacterized protein n=1 Tax=Auriscalpium vulgare TaxID=40419 RepID=A0ACB8R5C6_9AGAM|nr:hypothetical protein FA95DRAFT_1567555 [Auriscalpium vulgare]